MIHRLMETRLSIFDPQWRDRSKVLKAAQGLSLAEIARAADEAAKKAVLSYFGNPSNFLDLTSHH